ncbi:MAG: hypothetical protein CPSOU_1853 [uncultured Paraburkholderia sp.]|nr:MAG: hypothetical protein CPSOU_1853 [uncultured Paraburkholderia sp.]
MTTTTPSAQSEAQTFVTGLSRTQCNAIEYFVTQMRGADSATYVDMFDAFRDYLNSLVGPVQSSAVASAQATGEAVAWRDPSNLDSGQSVTFDKDVAAKWPHIYRQPLYATPPLTTRAKP